MQGVPSVLASRDALPGVGIVSDSLPTFSSKFFLSKTPVWTSGQGGQPLCVRIPACPGYFLPSKYPGQGGQSLCVRILAFLVPRNLQKTNPSQTILEGVVEVVREVATNVATAVTLTLSAGDGLMLTWRRVTEGWRPTWRPKGGDQKKSTTTQCRS